jgi:hypothetical protein
MWCWLREETGGRASVLAQRAASEDPRSGTSASWRAEGWAGEILRAVGAHPPVSSAVMDGGSRGKARSIMVNGKCAGIRLFVFCFLTVALATLAGCTTTPPREERQLKQATVEELTALLSQREAAIQTMKGLFSAKVRGGIIPIATRVEGAVYYQRPNAMRMRGFTAIGSELFEFVQVNDQFTLRLPTMGRVLSGSPSDMSEMGRLARPFQLSVWAMGGVLGTSAVATNETVKLVEDGERYRLDVSGPSQDGVQAIQRRLWFERRTLLVVKEDRLSNAGDVEATIQYEDFRPIGDANGGSAVGDVRLLRPFKISLEDGKGQGSVQVTFHEIIPNQPINASELGHV